VVEEVLPDLGIDGRVLDRGVGEDQDRGVDPLALILGDVGDQVAVIVGEAGVELEGLRRGQGGYQGAARPQAARR
jgi:hypothetical protein